MCETAFGPFSFDCSTGELFRNGQPVELPPKATLVLIALVTSAGRLVSHQKLYEAAWSETVVEFDQGLYTCIRQIRKALGDDARNPRYIETVPRRGYRFCHPLSLQQGSRIATGSMLRIAAAVLILFAAVSLISVQTERSVPPVENIVLSDFRIDGFEVSTGGIDAQLEASVRKSLAARGVTPDHKEPSFILKGRIAPSDDGALLHVSLVRLSDGVTVWEGVYDPFCPEVKGDPVRVIGRLVARTVAARVEQASA